MKLFWKTKKTGFKGHHHFIRCVAVTSDNKYIIYNSFYSTVGVWNINKNKEKTLLEGHLQDVTSVAVTFDNKYIISGSEDKTIKLWNIC